VLTPAQPRACLFCSGHSVPPVSIPAWHNWDTGSSSPIPGAVHETGLWPAYLCVSPLLLSFQSICLPLFVLAVPVLSGTLPRITFALERSCACCVQLICGIATLPHYSSTFFATFSTWTCRRLWVRSRFMYLTLCFWLPFGWRCAYFPLPYLAVLVRCGCPRRTPTPARFPPPPLLCAQAATAALYGAACPAGTVGAS